MRRRDFLKLMGSTTMAYAITGCADRTSEPGLDPLRPEPDLVDVETLCLSTPVDRDFSELILFLDSGRVAVFTGRSELGQGLTTVLVSLVSQAFELAPDRVDVHLADTELCPDDGPTSGSCATAHVAWPIWCACLEIKQDILAEGARRLGVEPGEVLFQQGFVFLRSDPGARISMFEMSRSGVTFTNPDTTPEKVQMYRDPGLVSVRGVDVVTGKAVYAGDVMSGQCVYGGFFTPPELHTAHRFKEADLAAARALPGVRRTGRVRRMGPFVVADTFPALQKAIAAVGPSSLVVRTGKKLVRNLAEVRKHARLVEVKESTGNPFNALKGCPHTLKETYTTHMYNVAFIEPCSSVATVDESGARVWDSTQHAHKQRDKVARITGIDPRRVRVTGTSVGGGFGGKIDHWSGAEAAVLAQETGLPVKLVYTRAEVFQRFSRAKEEVAVDIVSGVDADGRIVARTVDIYQDEGFGFTDTYDIPNSRVRLYRVPPNQMAIRHATIRGTSYTQDVFAMESHTSSLAHAIGVDPLELRLRNARWHQDLLQAAAERIGYGTYQPPQDHGLGMAIINHGGRQLGALFVEVGVDRSTGKITIERMRAAFDIGVVVCESTARTGIYGALLWGLSIALKEQIRRDDFRILTDSFSGYEIARFSDVPDIEFEFLTTYGRCLNPRGCGEMPLPLVAPAVANAVFEAVGVRLFSTPFTPDRVLRALASR